MRRLLSLLVCLLLSWPAFAEQLKRLGDLRVHYSVFNSSFLQPEIASAVGLTRSKNLLVINIVPQDEQGKPAKVGVTGIAKNLLGQEIPLTFKEVVEEGAVYHLAQMPVESREVLVFKIQIQPAQGPAQSFEFNQEVVPD